MHFASIRSEVCCAIVRAELVTPWHSSRAKGPHKARTWSPNSIGSADLAFRMAIWINVSSSKKEVAVLSVKIRPSKTKPCMRLANSDFSHVVQAMSWLRTSCCRTKRRISVEKALLISQQAFSVQGSCEPGLPSSAVEFLHLCDRQPPERPRA